MLALNTGEPQSTLKQKWPEHDARELAVYLSHELPLEQRLDFWGAQLLAAAVNPWRRKGRPSVDPHDLIPDWWGKVEEERSVDDWKEMLQGMAVAMGGKVIQDGKVVHNGRVNR